MGFSFHFSSLYPAPYIKLYVCEPIKISYLNFRAVLALPKSARSAQTHKNISFFWIVWSTLYVYLCQWPKTVEKYTQKLTLCFTATASTTATTISNQCVEGASCNWFDNGKGVCFGHFCQPSIDCKPWLFDCKG